MELQAKAKLVAYVTATAQTLIIRALVGALTPDAREAFERNIKALRQSEVWKPQEQVVGLEHVAAFEALLDIAVDTMAAPAPPPA